MALLIFVLLCFVSIAAGTGTLYILGFRKEDDPVFISSPLIALCIWSLVLGIGVSLRVPVRILTYLIWGISLILCLVAFNFYRFKKYFFPLMMCVGIALFISFPYVVHGFSGYTGSPFADGWSYIAFGQYLWEYPRCAEGGLAPLYQYAAHLCHTRFVASSLLGFISPLAGSPGDTQAASGYFFPWVFFVYASACAFFIWKHVSKLFIWGYVILCVVSGLLFTVMSANNFDHALAIGFLPAIAGILESINFAENRWAGLLAIILSSSVYIYPEMTPFIFLSAFLLLISRVIKDKIQFMALIRQGTIFILLFGLLVSIYSLNWFNFIHSQYSTLQAAVRPGESIASELTAQKYWFLGLWGLGGDDIRTAGQIFSTAMDWIRYFCAFALSLYLIVGSFMMVKDKKFGMIAVQIFLSVLITYFIVVQRYGYAAYKLISLLWWLVSYSIVLAVARIQAKERLGFIRVLSKYVFISALGVVIYVTLIREQQFDQTIMIKDITPYKELQTIQSVLNNFPVGISVSDPIANTWAMYYLRESITYFFSYQAYPSQSHVLPFMERSQKVNVSKINYLLTDAKGVHPEGADSIWQNSVYSLWKIKDSSFFIAGISNPNGIDLVNDQTFYWLGNQKTLIDIQSSFAGIISIVGDFTMGPSLPEITERNLMVTSVINGKSQSFNFTIRPGRNTIEIPVSSGNNKIELSVLNEPTVYSLPNGDPRVLLLGFQNIQLHFQNESEDK